jgi:hypothetical protein
VHGTLTCQAGNPLLELIPSQDTQLSPSSAQSRESERKGGGGEREGAESGPGHACVLCGVKCENKVGLREHAFLFLSLCLEGFANEGGFVLMISPRLETGSCPLNSHRSPLADK